MAHHAYKTKFTCSQIIEFDLDGDVVTNISFLGGCNGNLKAISKLLEGQTVGYIEGKLRGNTCGPRSTSCADQLAVAVREAYDEETSGEAQSASGKDTSVDAGD